MRSIRSESSESLKSNIEEDEVFNFDKSFRDDKRFKLMHEIAKDSGLSEVNNHLKMNKMGFGIDFFPNVDDLLKLSKHDHEFKKQAHPQPLEEIKPKKTIFLPPQKHVEVLEKDGSGMSYVTKTPFESWEYTIHKNPNIIFMPKTIEGVKNIIKWAKKNNKRVRATGYRHSSSDLYPDDNQILVSMLDLNTATHLPARYPKMDPNSDLQGIELIGKPYEVDGKIKIQCKIGSATCNYHLQDWVHDPKGGKWDWTLPLNVIMTEITLGGSNATLCHGAGIHNKTLSDLITEVQFINVKGELQTVNDKEQLKAAAGCFGMLGIVTHLTFELDKMTYANMKTVEKKLLALTIPPPFELIDSPQLKTHLSHKNLNALNALKDPKKLKQAFDEFIHLCEKNYYNEFFWFPLQEKCWINCWDNNGEKSKAERYPNEKTIEMQRGLSYLAYLANNMMHDNKQTPGIRKFYTKIIGDVSMATLPDKPKTVCSLHDALHFRQGIQNFRATRMMEIEFPFGTDKFDWRICVEAWWAVIESVYSEKNQTYFPMRTTLEMRIMGGSDVLMAAQHGNQRTCSIEILTPHYVDQHRWDEFRQEILDKWAKIQNDKGEYLNIRPHWAKNFDNLNINRETSWINEWDDEQKKQLRKYVKPDSNIVSIPMQVYLKTIAYKNQIVEFKKQLKAICKDGGYEFKDIQKRFFNEWLDDLMASSFKPQVQLCFPFHNLFSKKKSLHPDNEPNYKHTKTSLGKF